MSEKIVDDFVKAISASLAGFDHGNEQTRILVALSGGPDSTALLLAMHRLTQSSNNLLVTAAHVNHHLRGAESDNDENFCRQLCKSLHIPLKVYQDNFAGSSASENVLRDTRYAFLHQTAIDDHLHAVMTAHTINDQAETILFRLIRGTSLKGLSGIKQSRKFAEGVVLLRPLLALSRDDVNAFLLVCAVIAREDSSNSQLKYSRNFIRQAVLKPIEERFAGASERIAGFSAKAALDNDFIERQAEGTFEQLSLSADRWDLDELRYLHEALLTRIFALGLKHREIEIDSARIETLQSMLYVGDDYRVSLDGVWDVSVDRNHIQWLNKESEEASCEISDFEIVVEQPGLKEIPGTEKSLNIEKFSDELNVERGKYPEAASLEVLVDLSKFESETVILRRRKACDFIQPLGMTEKVRLKKYLHTRKASHKAGFVASRCIVLACEQEILWVPGIGLSEQIKVKLDSQPTHKLSIVDLASETSEIPPQS